MVTVMTTMTAVMMIMNDFVFVCVCVCLMMLFNAKII
jgi:hypothetical protein